MKNLTLPISGIEHLNSLYFVLTLDIGELASEIKAGQFFQIKPHERHFPMLRKPISVYNLEGSYLSLMIKIMGEGTQNLSQLRTGNRLDVLGPLGNGFPILTQKKAVLVSGGIGYPPLWQLKKELLNARTQYYWLHGGRDMHDIFPADEIWTDNGSYGKHGMVTEGLNAFLQKDKPDVIYACGPKPMLKACSEIASRNGITLYVSLEEYMACGIGVCHGCAVAVTDKDSGKPAYKLVCKDGPVFDASEVIWD